MVALQNYVSGDTIAAQSNHDKNRYTDILPYDHSRVVLVTHYDGVDHQFADYINASYIPGFQSPRDFIATQGPKGKYYKQHGYRVTGEETEDDFWRMVWEKDCSTIIMLAKTFENGREKCTKYWPDVRSKTVSLFLWFWNQLWRFNFFSLQNKLHRMLVFAQQTIRVTYVSEISGEHWTKTYLRLSRVTGHYSAPARQITHYQV